MELCQKKRDKADSIVLMYEVERNGKMTKETVKLAPGEVIDLPEEIAYMILGNPQYKGTLELAQKKIEDYSNKSMKSSLTK